MQKQIVQHYINNFRRFLSPYLKPDVAIQSTTFPFKGGTLVKFAFNPDANSKDEFENKSGSILEVLHRAKIEDLNVVKNDTVFKGTNVLLAKSFIYLIKEDSEAEWSESQAKKDVDKIIHPNS